MQAKLCVALPTGDKAKCRKLSHIPFSSNSLREHNGKCGNCSSREVSEAAKVNGGRQSGEGERRKAKWRRTMLGRTSVLNSVLLPFEACHKRQTTPLNFPISFHCNFFPHPSAPAELHERATDKLRNIIRKTKQTKQKKAKRQAGRQASKQASKHANKRTNEQTNKRTNEQTKQNKTKHSNRSNRSSRSSRSSRSNRSNRSNRTRARRPLKVNP
ncbi:hypothetical protein POVWA1_038480 [Plasmodium ovale wallikeri]|uniref:Uncharacterized protein n=1 Tax=Plasmodium ovale wallikeri TaxID=864142 RepID=A0A1A8Z452_PLAOA|nr:hypothetical protein POVWA1_038480 [Plasmodium ovale wallikeri]